VPTAGHDRALPLRLRLSRALLGDCVMREVMGGFRRQPNIFSSHIRSQSGQTRTHVRNATTLFQDQLVIVAGASNGWWRRRRDVADLIAEPWSLPPYDVYIGSLIEVAFRNKGLHLGSSSACSVSDRALSFDPLDVNASLECQASWPKAATRRSCSSQDHSQNRSLGPVSFRFHRMGVECWAAGRMRAAPAVSMGGCQSGICRGAKKFGLPDCVYLHWSGWKVCTRRSVRHCSDAGRQLWYFCRADEAAGMDPCWAPKEKSILTTLSLGGA